MRYPYSLLEASSEQGYLGKDALQCNGQFPHFSVNGGA